MTPESSSNPDMESEAAESPPKGLDMKFMYSELADGDQGATATEAGRHKNPEEPPGLPGQKPSPEFEEQDGSDYTSLVQQCRERIRRSSAHLQARGLAL